MFVKIDNPKFILNTDQISRVEALLDEDGLAKSMLDKKDLTKIHSDRSCITFKDGVHMVVDVSLESLWEILKRGDGNI